MRQEHRSPRDRTPEEIAKAKAKAARDTQRLIERGDYVLTADGQPISRALAKQLGIDVDAEYGLKTGEATGSDKQ